MTACDVLEKASRDENKLQAEVLFVLLIKRIPDLEQYDDDCEHEKFAMRVG